MIFSTHYMNKLILFTALAIFAISATNYASAVSIDETDTYRMIGLSNGDADQNYTDIDFAIYPNKDGLIKIFEGSVSHGEFGTYQTGDILKVAVESGVVKYYNNNAILYTSEVSPVYPLLVDTSLYHIGSTLKDVQIGGDNWDDGTS